MKIWMIALAVGFLAVASLVMVNALQPEDVIEESSEVSSGGCGSCNGGCSAGNSCGSPSCGATVGKTCVCGRR